MSDKLEKNETKETGESKPGKPEEIVPKAIASFTRQMKSISECATVHIAHAVETHRTRVESILTAVNTGMVVKKTSDGEVQQVGIRFQSKQQMEEFREIVDAVPHGSHSDVLAKSLLIFGFSTFDAFLGALLRSLFRINDQLIHKLEEKEITLSDLLHAKTTEAVINNLIERDISSLLRKSYDELFSKLANRHGVKSLKEFDDWPSFIECSQRRNLITHCDGVVNEEYLSKCRAAGVPITAGMVVGKKLGVSSGYLADSLDLLYAVGVMLAHTLWRISREDHIESSEEALVSEMYGLLLRQKWKLTRSIGKFAVEMRKTCNDLQVKIIRLNYAQAVKWEGDNNQAMKILNEVDWSSSIRELRLGVAVLRDSYDEAAELMRGIGKSGELIDQDGYGEWPIFRIFRDSDQFKTAYRGVYGMEFAVDSVSGSKKTSEESDTSLADKITLSTIESRNQNNGDLPVSKEGMSDAT